ncbi:hypothetical protein [Candidatus Methanodesulfokora washburnensis]|nr:hypothetical protein [Candidatus Methanodesulfokores washburnensis]
MREKDYSALSIDEVELLLVKRIEEINAILREIMDLLRRGEDEH